MASGDSAPDRRVKSALFLLACVWAGMAPHWLAPDQRLIPSISLALLLGGYSIRTVLLQALRRQKAAAQPATEGAVPERPAPELPSVDVVVAARDEEAVIGRLVERIARIRYPEGRLRLWVVDDGSEDATPELLRELERTTPLLRVLRRSREAGGGKSGALNDVLQHLEGRWMLVLDADAGLAPDLLERVLPQAETGGWAAVQLRKAVVNGGVNLLTRAQAMEMALDAVIQEGRLAEGGVAELRGNGQLLLREAVQASGGFNEATVTDDLDLSFRLLLAGQPIGVQWDPPVEEEAVLTLAALWRQRQRWAEGGLQRFFDYGDGLVFGPLAFRQKLDLACFFLLQYVLPVASIADLAGALLTRTLPTVWPLSIAALGLSGLAIVTGCRRPSEGPALPAMGPLAMGLGIVYLVHWFVVIPWVSLRMAVLPKRLVWVKTLHLGDASEPGFPEGPVPAGRVAASASLDEAGLEPETGKI
ncbi:MAG: glycosyltransferase family 2 protein [Synechococcus sp.]|nr:glycosyltransferase family 2 protein [Synechococcus sp.]